MTSALIYMWGIADNLRASLCGIWVFASVVSVLSLIAYAGSKWEDLEEGAQLAMAILKKSTAIFLTIICAWAFAPSSNTIAAMVVIPKISNSEAIKQGAPALYEAAIRKLNEALQTK